MPGNPTDPQAESLVVSELLGRSSGLTREALHGAVAQHISSERADAAVESLTAASVLRSTPRRVYPSEALERLDKLGRIPV